MPVQKIAISNEELEKIFFPDLIAHCKALILLNAPAREIAEKTGLPPRLIRHLRERIRPPKRVADPSDDDTDSVLSPEEVRQPEHHVTRSRTNLTNTTPHGRAERKRRRAQKKRVDQLLKAAGIRPLATVAKDPDPPPPTLMEPEPPCGNWRTHKLFQKPRRHTGGPDTGTDTVPTDDDDLIPALTGDNHD